jgi:arylsulfatase
MKQLIRTLFLLVLFLFSGCSENKPPVQNNEDGLNQNIAATRVTAPPNILLIVVDDLGFNDLSLFGSEITTPNIDTLAEDGIVLTDFHVAPTCSPTRAMLLSGTDNHIAGLGNMHEEMPDNQKGQPGYEGYLNFRIAALPELMQDAGYHTYMTGKWHLGLTEETSPAARGFEKSFALLQGGAGAFSNMLQIFGPEKAMYREDRQLLDSLPEDFYSTKFYTEKMIDYIDSSRGDGKPFFSYLAFTSPHWPLQAPAESIAKYRGKYDEGYEVLRERRFNKLKEQGLYAQDTEPFPRLPGEPSWAALTNEEQQYEARKMEIYAAMVDDVDIYIGRLIDYLKEIGEYENTFIFFMSDNGPEAHDLERGWEGMTEFVESCCDNSLENMGNSNSYVWYGLNWGQAGNVPRRMFKGFPSQGGINAPAFVHYPKAMQKDVINKSFVHVMDVMPTLLELTDISHPGSRFKDRDVVPMQGVSMLSMLQGHVDKVHSANHVTGWELFSKRALRQGDWKIIYAPYQEVFEPRPPGIKTDTWQLYNLLNDPAEKNDLAEQFPDKLKDMILLWEEYAEENGIVLPNSISGY